jgi:phosphoribosylformylglycinamidine cyclo-ligase
MTSQSLTYADAGVSLDASERAMAGIKDLVRSTSRPEVLSDIGSFGGLFALGRYEQPVLVSSTDSVGTKLKVAFMVDRHDTVGYDIVAHCGNDIVVQGAEPLFFLDYVGTSRLRPAILQQIVQGLADGCRHIGAALIGGETAELPDFYQDGEYDLVGTIVGVVEKDEIITGQQITAGDSLVGLPSLGLHTNGYSLARRILFERCGHDIDHFVPELDITVGQELLKNHQSYVKTVLDLKSRCQIRGIAHITGGGLPDNVIRILPDNCCAVIWTDSWQIPPIFTYLQQRGNVDLDEMYRVFNMGIGLVLVVRPTDVGLVLSSVDEAILIGEVESGQQEVKLV